MKKASRTEGDEEEDEGGEEAAMNAMMSSIPVPRPGLVEQASHSSTAATIKNSSRPRPRVIEMSPEEEEEELENR